ncbi:MAG: FKBP-type peptidyl-prolyl cis-trans isomerase [Balneolaceae bacterium]
MRFINNILSFAVLVVLIITVISCDTQDPYRVDFSSAPDPFPIENSTKIETESGLAYYVIEEGDGEEVVRRSEVALYYTGRTMDGEIFDSSYRSGNPNPTTFNDLGSLVKGFREGVIGMKEGGKRVLIIPPDLGYGNSSTHALRNDTLRFDIELDEVGY